MDRYSQENKRKGMGSRRGTQVAWRHLQRWWRRWLIAKRHIIRILDPDDEWQLPIKLGCHSLNSLSPFYLLLSSKGTIEQCGSSIRRLHVADPVGHNIEDLFQMTDQVDATTWFSENCHNLEGQLIRLEAQFQPGLEFAAQLIDCQKHNNNRLRHHQHRSWLLDCRPILENLEDLDTSGLTLQDLSLLDPIRVSMVSVLMEDALRKELLSELRNNQNLE